MLLHSRYAISRSGFLIMRCIIPGLTAAALSESAANWEQQGRALFAKCEFGGAARAFRRAAAAQPDNAELQFWLGRSYERMAEASSPLTATKSARKTECSLKQALHLDPKNEKYVFELFDLYVDWQEWFDKAPARASDLLERITSTTPEEEPMLRIRLAEARQDGSGPDASYRRVILLPSRIFGHIVP
jgi:tetratricopeptide (TPR) repeat protein